MTKDEKHGDFFERLHEDCPDKQFGKIKASPIELRLLGTLRCLTHGWMFDGFKESTFITREVHRVFFHKFVELGSKIVSNVCLFAFNIGRAQRL
jgi:hypothetical protein